MTKKENPNVGSTFESWLDEQGIREEGAAAAITEVIAEQLAADYLLDPTNNSAMLESLMRAAKSRSSKINRSRNSSAIFCARRTRSS